MVLCAIVVAALFRSSLLVAFGRTLVCKDERPPASNVVLDAIDNDFGLFRRGAELERAGLVSRVFVPVAISEEQDAATAAQEGAAVSARVAGLSRWQIIPVVIQEPISINAAYRVRDVLLGEGVASVTLVSNGFRSRRSEMIYRSVLEERSISTRCMPVFGTVNPLTWTQTWHGIQDVGLQFLKLQYYRFCVLPFQHNR
jgi:hypothetical protein